ncbi:MAG: binding-protein-dependent transport system inner rane component [Firmicutes bacterium]|nr:binding-protein-dependent transport system inner rane component [Bacillota bacterium]
MDGIKNGHVALRGDDDNRLLDVWKRFRRRGPATVGFAILILLLALTAAAPFLVRYSPTVQDLSQSLLSPSATHPFGTDHLGRDILTRILFGARLSLMLGVLAVGVGLVVGVPLGAISGYYGGWVDMLIQRLTDLLLSFPSFLLALSLVAILGVGLGNVILSVGIGTIPSFIRVVRAAVLVVREQPFVESARAAGASNWRILWHHIIPNIMAPVIVQASLGMGNTILMAAGLGFLGLGVKPPAPEWGSMLGEGRQYIFSAWHMTTFPGLAIFLAVVAFNLVGDGLRDALDPRLR